MKKNNKPKSVLIIGAGIAGLSAAYSLSQKGYQVTLIEKEDHVGGLSSTFKWGKFSLDLGPHKIYTTIPHVLKKMKQLLGKELIARPKTSKIYLFNSYLEYPIQIINLIKKMGPLLAIRFAFDYGFSQIINLVSGRQPQNSEEYLQYFYGQTAYQHVFAPLSNKIWGNPKTLDVNLAKTRVPAPTIFQLVAGMLFGTKNQPTVSADCFYYPKQGIGELSKAMLKVAQKHSAVIKYQTVPTKIKIKNHRVESVTLSDKTVHSPDIVISTSHLSHLISLIYPKVTPLVKKAASSLKHRSLILVYLVFNKDRLIQDSWMFFPEKKFIFNRLSEQKAFSESMVPPHKTVLIAEITCEYGDNRWAATDDNLVSKVVADLKKALIIKVNDQIVDSKIIKVGHGYPVYDLNYQKNRTQILDYLSGIDNLYSIGRPGLFFYNNMDHSFDIGQKLADHLHKNKPQRIWRIQLNEFFNSKIVD